MSENKDNKLTLINEKTANDYLTHTKERQILSKNAEYDIIYLWCLTFWNGLKYGAERKQCME